MYLKTPSAPPTTISTPCQTERIESAKVDEPVALPVTPPCESSTANEVVSQHDDGVKQHKEAGQDPMVDGSLREAAVSSAVPSDAGVRSCEATGDAVPFQADVQGDTQFLSG